MKIKLLTGSSIAALLICGATQSYAGTVTAYVYGEYDTGGIGDLPSSVTSGLTFVNNGSHYDTPALFFVNPSSYSITGAQILLNDNLSVNNGWNTRNNGVSQLVSLGTLAPDSVTEIAWGGSGPLFNDDYDDNYNGGNSTSGPGYGYNPFPGTIPGLDNPGSALADCTLSYGPSAPHPEWQTYCSPIGNFEVTFSGILSGSGGENGDPVQALFGEYNLANSYVGWQGIDPNGWSENALYDVHSGIVSGVLADICLSTGTSCSSPLSGPKGVPEPATVSLLAAGLGALAATRRRRKQKQSV